MLGQQLDTIVYNVRSGDSLSRIISRYYGSVSPQKRRTIIAQIQQDNPKVKNPDRIMPNQALIIDIPPQYCAAPVEERATPVIKDISKQQLKELQNHWNNSNPKQQSLLTSLAPMMLGGGQLASNTLGRLLSSNTQQLQTIINRYEAYKSGAITKGQYDYARRVAIQKFTGNMGFARRLLSRKRNQRQILRISRKKGRAPARNISRQIGRMKTLSRLAVGGGVILSAVNLNMSCNAIGEANTTVEKNQIFAETLGGTITGSIFGGLTYLVFAATPVGWGVALVLAAGSVAYSSLGKKAGRYVYDTRFRKIDLLSKTGVSRLCG